MKLADILLYASVLVGVATWAHSKNVALGIVAAVVTGVVTMIMPWMFVLGAVFICVPSGRRSTPPPQDYNPYDRYY